MLHTVLTEPWAAETYITNRRDKFIFKILLKLFDKNSHIGHRNRKDNFISHWIMFCNIQADSEASNQGNPFHQPHPHCTLYNSTPVKWRRKPQRIAGSLPGGNARGVLPITHSNPPKVLRGSRMDGGEMDLWSVHNLCCRIVEAVRRRGRGRREG